MDVQQIVCCCLVAMLDVRKQSSLSGFYRHLLNQTTGEEAIPEGSASSIALTKDEVQR